MPHIIEEISHVDWQELKEIIAAPDRSVVVIDVREPEEYEAAHIAGLPLIPMGDIIDWTEKLDPEQEYVFVCRSGRRSFEVAKYFKNNGFSKVHNFAGGMLSWASEGNATETGSAEPIESYGLDQPKGDNGL